jgi:hypothetical protein
MNVLLHICAFNAIRRAITKHLIWILEGRIECWQTLGTGYTIPMFVLCEKGTKKYEVHLKMPKETHTCDCARFHQ